MPASVVSSTCRPMRRAETTRTQTASPRWPRRYGVVVMAQGGRPAATAAARAVRVPRHGYAPAASVAFLRYAGMRDGTLTYRRATR